MSLGCCIEYNSATPKGPHKALNTHSPTALSSLAFLSLASSGPRRLEALHIFRKYLISSCLRPPACKVCQLVLCVGLPHICFTLIQTVSHWQPEGKMASLCVSWLCEWRICWVRSLSLSCTQSHAHTQTHKGPLI